MSPDAFLFECESCDTQVIVPVRDPYVLGPVPCVGCTQVMRAKQCVPYPADIVSRAEDDEGNLPDIYDPQALRKAAMGY